MFGRYFGTRGGAACRTVAGRPEDGAPHTGGEGTGQTASVVLPGGSAFLQNLARSGIVEIPRILQFVLVYLKDLQSGTVGTVVGHMDGIAVAVACSVEHPAVVVEGSRAPDHFVASVPVNVADGEVVVAVAEHGAAADAVVGCLLQACLHGLRAVACSIPRIKGSTCL